MLIVDTFSLLNNENSKDEIFQRTAAIVNTEIPIEIHIFM